MELVDPYPLNKANSLFPVVGLFLSLDLGTKQPKKDGKSDKIGQFEIKILPGDFVTVELSPYDLSMGRIVYRH